MILAISTATFMVLLCLLVEIVVIEQRLKKTSSRIFEMFFRGDD